MKRGFDLTTALVALLLLCLPLLALTLLVAAKLAARNLFASAPQHHRLGAGQRA